MRMNILLCDSREEATRRAAALVYRQVAEQPRSVLGWATGGTMDAFYAELVLLQQQRPLSWRELVSFNLDEYVGLAADHPQSYRFYMRHRVFIPLGMNEDRTHLLSGDAPDGDEACAAYEMAIAKAGGIDLQLLGIGENGHMGFNEPGSSLASRTRFTRLTAQTIEANQRFFAPGEFQPHTALTMGIQTILEAKQVVMLALGAKKAQAVAAMVEGPLGEQCPASALQMHPSTTVVLDPEAAQLLRLKDAYRQAHPDAGVGT
jgi:glucosamine-6-phosphate deaminase